MAQCKEILQKRITDDFLQSDAYTEEADIKKKLEEIVGNTDRQIAFDKTCDCKLNGCTFTFVVFYKSIFYTVNVGSAHCLYTTLKEASAKSNASRGNLSSMAGSEARVSNLGSEFGSVTKGATYSTNNPLRAATFLFTATRDLMTKVHNAKLHNFNANIANKVVMEIVSTDHSVTNYDELLRLTKEGSVVCKDKKKVDLPYYARPFKFYIDPATPSSHQSLLSNWPAMRCSRALGCLQARNIGLLPTPSVSSRKMIRGRDMFVVIATDGFWSVLETVEVVYLLLSEIFRESAGFGVGTPAPATSGFSAPGTALLPNSRSTAAPRKVSFPTGRNMATLLGAHARLRLANMASKHLMKLPDLSIVIIGLF